MRVNKKDLYWQADLIEEVFLIDLSWLFYKSWYSYKNLSVEKDGEERYTGHIFGVLRTLISIKEYNQNTMIILCEDGVPEERKEENENYKANRSHDLKYNIWEDLNIIYDMAYKLKNVFRAYHPKKEADDILYALAKNIEKKTDDTYIYIHSSDNDLLQALSERIKIVKKISKYGLKNVIDKDNIYEKKTMIKNFRHCPIEKLPFYRAIVGDNSDNIEGIFRFPRKLATKIAENCENLEDMLDLELEGLTEAKQRRLQQVKDNFQKIKSNYKIMNLTEDINFRIYRDDNEKCKRRAEKYADELKMDYYKEYLLKTGLINTI